MTVPEFASVGSSVLAQVDPGGGVGRITSTAVPRERKPSILGQVDRPPEMVTARWVLTVCAGAPAQFVRLFLAEGEDAEIGVGLDEALKDFCRPGIAKLHLKVFRHSRGSLQRPGW